uniref:Large ribosomal subunit protein uL3c n=1 Tax=Polysiphonia sertularioides TaxID=945028 RepID=A0A1Z1MG81_9FLOR|nr:ribosomal protein L3 [Polysiphonia sertularioides]
MATGVLGRKIGMTQIFSEQGLAIPVTLLQVNPCAVVSIRREKNYSKIQIGFEEINPSKITKPMVGHFAKNNVPCFKYLKEYKSRNTQSIKLGQTIKITDLNQQKKINVRGISIGKGFSGYQKRHKFSRGPMSHGSKNHRQPGSIGAGTTPGRVFPGKKMAGRMGYNKVSIKNLQIVKINESKNILIIKGCVPGKKGNMIYITQN